jgi:mono/diheme cytochrome c family protein
MSQRLPLGFFLLGLTGLFVGVRSAAAAAPVDFSREVRPILSKHCFACHGPDAAGRASKLRLDRRDSVIATGKQGRAAVVPGAPDKSELVRRIGSTDDDDRMPPPEAKNPLTPAQVATLKRWVAEGAPYADHWAFVKPRRPALPPVKDRGWVRNGIDTFVLARLEKEGLKPSPEADRYTLLRRASFDLRGLPPSPQEVAAFEKDAAPDAYEKAVDRLLEDSAFGERWARMWLDLARYADSAGYGSDPLRPNVWRYRDWVIDAFNRNLPYDRFTVEQLAGDLLPSPTLEQRVATAFHRNTMTNTEGGTDREEFRVAAVKDRVDTTMQVWMGLTMGCAKCHSHKFDPITQKEYYRFFALFNQTEDNDQPNESPTMPAPTVAQKEETARIDAHLAGLKKQLDVATPELAAAQTKWEAGLRSHPAWNVVRKLVPPAPSSVFAVVDTPSEKRTPEQQARLAGYYRGVAPATKPIRDEIARLEKSRPVPPPLPVMVELPPERHRQTNLMVKGNFLDKGDKVEPGIPSSFHPLPPGAKLDRLGVAQWIVSPDNPLTARVAVNRFWAQLWGTGIVVTEEDFGTQGELPSHPELLDWLATEYVRLGWDTKALLKMMVTSAAYRQSSRVTPELIAKDPKNRLLTRGPRFRLEAEMVRDQALALGGLLSHKVGGPSVYPPQPGGLWQAAFNGQRTYPTSTGEDRYRRGLYTFWRRTIPYPSMTTFDAPSRETCTLRRVRTNTPLQAFVTLNDPVFVEAAQALARRIMKEGGAGTEERARFGLRLVLSRPASAEQVKRVVALFEEEREHYKKDAKAATALATEPLGPLPARTDPAEAAAWTVVANVLLNLDGVMTKG